MKYIKLGDCSISVIGLGAWQIGTRSWGWEREFGPKNIRDMLSAAHEVGINFIDTAELYGRGESERQLGYHLKFTNNQFIVASKVSPNHLTESGVYKAAIESLQRLQLPFLNLYQIHVPNPIIPISKTMLGMRRLLREDKIQNVGVSNFSINRWQKAESTLGSTVIANQVEFNLLHSGAVNELKPMLNTGHVMIAYSPLAKGLLTGKYSTDKRPPDFRSIHPDFSRRNYKNVQKILTIVEEIAKAHNISISQVALAWVISHPNVIAIPGAKSPEQIKQNAAAAEIRLSTSEIAALDMVSKSYRSSWHLPRPFETFKWFVAAP